MAEIRLRPQPGAQTAFLSSPADIVFYGGAAGGGKTWALIAEPLRHINKPGFTAVVFRRNATQIFNPGGLWDEACKLYPLFGGAARLARYEWVFPSGAYIRFGHLSEESTVYNWQGSQNCLICFDEVTHFTEKQFTYMMSRNRSTCGVRPYIRATCNPNSDSWVKRYVDWWINSDSGYPIKERSGVIRYMARIDNEIIFADTAEELTSKYGAECMPKSITFIPASLYDNKILMEANPEYLANLKGLSKVERERLLYGNWKIRASAGNNFRREWVQMIDIEELPPKLRLVRGWDLAGTPVTPESPDPDYTVSVLMGKDMKTETVYVIHGFSMRDTPGKVEDAIVNFASQDGMATTIGLAQDPGQAGKAQCAAYAKKLARFHVKTSPESGDKEVRFRPFSAACEHGNVVFVRGPWNEEFFDYLEKFKTEGIHDDHADAMSRAYNTLQEGNGPIRINPAILQPRLPGMRR